MNHRRELIICLGSSCFSRGNSSLLKIIQRYINLHGLSEKVHFKGDHCFGSCSEGPSLKIGGKLYHQVSDENIHSILGEALHDLLKQEK
ncbi:MAG: (2Fe-2S) ferredoxin domain-containing protein [Bacteroidales bacterium]|nr:(2Fe-2S) ferredoxin domain-containing protein [Bacteroidales bacterium]